MIGMSIVTSRCSALGACSSLTLLAPHASRGSSACLWSCDPKWPPFSFLHLERIRWQGDHDGEAFHAVEPDVFQPAPGPTGRSKGTTATSWPVRVDWPPDWRTGAGVGARCVVQSADKSHCGRGCLFAGGLAARRRDFGKGDIWALDIRAWRVRSRPKAPRASGPILQRAPVARQQSLLADGNSRGVRERVRATCGANPAPLSP